MIRSTLASVPTGGSSINMEATDVNVSSVHVGRFGPLPEPTRRRAPQLNHGCAASVNSRIHLIYSALAFFLGSAIQRQTLKPKPIDFTTPFVTHAIQIRLKPTSSGMGTLKPLCLRAPLPNPANAQQQPGSKRWKTSIC